MKKYFVILVCFLLILTGCKKTTETNTYPKVNMSAYYHYNNKPIYGIHVQAFNYETAYRKIRTGKFKDGDFSHYTLDSVRKNYQVKDKMIELDEYKFGEGIKNTPSDARQIVRLLFENSLDYLTYMNGLKPEVFLKNPDNPRYKFSNNTGKLVGNLESGLTLLRDTTGTKEYKLVTIKKNSVVYLGNTRPPKQKIVLNGKTSIKNTSVDFGETITYKIPVTSKQLLLKLSPNFVIDSTNYDYKEIIKPELIKVAKNGDLVTQEDSLDVLNGEIKYKVRKMQLGKNDKEEFERILSTQLSNLYSIKQLQFEFNNNMPKELIIRGHVASKVTYDIPVILVKPDDSTESIVKSSEVYHSNITQGLYVMDSQGALLTPELESYGINFATYDVKSNKPTAKSVFLLGKIKNGKVLMLKTEGDQVKWFNTRLSMRKFKESNIKEKAFGLLGNNYNYVDGNRKVLPINYNFWIYDVNTQSKENKPLYKIRGLSSSEKYFLLPKSKTSVIVNNNKPFYFKVGEDSIKNAINNNYELNGFLPDHEYEKEEYNAIPISRKDNEFSNPINPLIRFGTIIMGIILFYIFTIFVIIKKINI